MSVINNIHIGPYAEFSVPPGRAEDFPPKEEGGEFLCWETLRCNFMFRREDCYRYTPTGDGPEGRTREMFTWQAGPSDQDLTGLDRQAEMDWLASAYAEPLRLLSEEFGSPPRIRWGVLSWFD